MNTERASGRQRESYLLPLAFDTLLSAPLISGNNALSLTRTAAIVTRSDL